MKSHLTFDPQKLNSLLKDFYNLTRIRITVFDDHFQELAAYPEELSPFCRLIRTDSQGAVHCKRCDTQACAIASKRRSPYTYRCHAGLTESIAPIHLGNIVVGYLFFGQVFSYSTHKEGWNIIRELCKVYDLDQAHLLEACLERPVITDDYITSASHILQAVASYLCLEQMVSLRRQELPAQIDEYISAHLAQPLDAAAICRQFQIGKTQLYEIAKQNYGVGIAQHIRNLRMEKAKRMLEDSPLPLAEIAFQCGFKDYNYFITVFRRVVGVSPKKYAKTPLTR